MPKTVKVIDEKREQYKKWIWRMSEDPTGREEMGNALGMTISHSEDLKNEAVVAVLVPSYKNLHPNMLDARSRLITYSKQYCKVYAEPIMGSSVISWVRNDMLAGLYRSKKKFTHVLFIDDDMVFEPDSLVRMLKHEKDIVGSCYVTRSDPPAPNLHLVNVESSEARRVVSWEQEGLNVEGNLISAKSAEDTLTVGTGLVLYSRAVIDRLGEMYQNFEYEQKLYSLDPSVFDGLREKRKEICKSTGNSFWFQFLPRTCGWGESGEDTSFCIKAAMCGFKTYADISIQPGHVGEYQYSYEDFKPYQASEIEKAKSMKLYF